MDVIFNCHMILLNNSNFINKNSNFIVYQFFNRNITLMCIGKSMINQIEKRKKGALFMHKPVFESLKVK